MKRSGFLLAAAFLIIAMATWPAAAQAPLGDSDSPVWATPVNLSRSGAASDPHAVVDNAGQYHVLWLDEFDGFVYASGDGETWSDSEPVELPFATRRYLPDLRATEETPLFAPSLIADPSQRIHAFWLDTSDNTELPLYTSNVEDTSVPVYNQWTPRQRLSDSAIAFDSAISADGQAHLVYLQTAESTDSPAGIYYRRLMGDGVSWSNPVMLHGSVYFRLLESGDATLLITAGAEGQLAVVWEDHRSGSLQIGWSVDGGDTWSAPSELVRLDAATISARDSQHADRMPAIAALAADSTGQIHLFWWSPSENDCALSHGLLTANDRLDQVAEVPDVSCGNTVSAASDQSGRIVLLDAGEKSATLQAWDETGGSELLPLPIEFEDPDTNQTVHLGCFQPLLGSDSTLGVVGCDQAGGGEVWMVLSAEGMDYSELFVAPPLETSSVWGTPVQISPPGYDAQISVLSLSIAADRQGAFHLVWSQTDEQDPNGLGHTLVYALWDPDRPDAGARPVTLYSSTDEKAEQPALAADSLGRLHLVWSGGIAGEITYSRVNAAQASQQLQWDEPRVLPMPGQYASSPALAVSVDGAVHVAFAVPLNEGRGIYYIRSDDGGDTWGEAVLVADAIEQNWAMVDHPTLAVGNDGTIHIAWSSLPLPGSALSASIRYARSDNAGDSWSDPLEIAAGQVDWPQLAAAGNHDVHLIWRENDYVVRTWHWRSTSAGLDWVRGDAIGGLEQVEGPIKLTTDAGGGVHLTAAARPAGAGITQNEMATRLELHHRLWDGESWQELPSEMNIVLDINKPRLSVFAVAPNGRVALAFADTVLVKDESDEKMAEERITLLNSEIELNPLPPSPLPTGTPTVAPSPEPTMIATPQPTPTPDLTAGGSPELRLGPISLGSDWAGLMLGAAPAGLIVLLVLFAGILIVRRSHR